MRFLRVLLRVLIAIAVSPLAHAVRYNPPGELLPLVPPDTKYLAHAKADLNGDGREDYVLVVEQLKPDEPGTENRGRLLFVIVREADGALVRKKTSEGVVLCGNCGGAFGDPFEDVSAIGNTFTVRHYGGSAWRWQFEFQFGYSRRNNTWQLVRVQEMSYHTSDPNKQEVKIFRPPRDFGKIDIEDFDPEKFKGVGKR